MGNLISSFIMIKYPNHKIVFIRQDRVCQQNLLFALDKEMCHSSNLASMSKNVSISIIDICVPIMNFIPKCVMLKFRFFYGVLMMLTDTNKKEALDFITTLSFEI